MRTGNYRIRRGWFGRCILQYQSRVPQDQHCMTWVYTWSDEKYDAVGSEAEIVTKLRAALQQADKDLAHYGGQSHNDTCRIKIKEALS